MTQDRPLIEERSKALFGQVHRLALMVAIAQSPDGRVNPTELAVQLRLSQSAFQAPLRDLVTAGLLTREVDGRRNVYIRRESKLWDAVLEFNDAIVTEEMHRAEVHALRLS